MLILKNISMAVAKLTYVQSVDGKTLTFTDESTLDAPITNYTRTVELWSNVNASGELIDTLTFTSTGTTVQYELDKDRYFSAKFTHSGSPSVPVLVINFVTKQYEQNLLFEKSKKNCGCVKSGKCDSTFNGFIDLYLAELATLVGNGALANSLISSSYKYLKS